MNTFTNTTVENFEENSKKKSKSGWVTYKKINFNWKCLVEHLKKCFEKKFFVDQLWNQKFLQGIKSRDKISRELKTTYTSSCKFNRFLKTPMG
jgi:hypothetical protein